jgi:hypothetical protein
LDVDAALPFGTFDQQRRIPQVKVERIGEEIVNSISIHRIQDEDAHLDDIVAVLTNNDRTVRVFSLPSGHETACKDLPFAINHATISPDGRLLVAVGDYNQAYFYRREIIDDPPQIPKPHNRLTSASVDWRRLCKVTLHVSAPEMTVGYFTTAWSPNGQLMAVGSEGGYITVIDRESLEDDDLDDENRDDAIAAVIPGSRADQPSPHPGAIRSMIFSPDPWDLLIWAEDQGRICIGDLRTGLKSRQVVNLEPKEEALRKFELNAVEEDFAGAHITHVDDLETELLRRYRATPDNASAVNFASDYVDARRRQREHRQSLAAARLRATQAGTRPSPASATLDDEQRQGLTSTEQQILETMRLTRQREEARANGLPPRSINYTSPDMFPTATAGARSSSNTPVGETTSRNNPNDTSRNINDILNSVQDFLPELSRTHAASPRTESSPPDPGDPLPLPSSMQDAIWTSATRQPSGSSNSRLPRRRQSIILSPPTSASDSTSSRRDPPPPDADEANPWRTVEEELLADATREHLAAAARGPLFERAARALPSSPLPAERPRDPDRDRDPDRRSDRLGILEQDIATQRRIAASAARTRERWRTSRPPVNSGGGGGGGGASVTAATAAATVASTAASTAASTLPLAEARRQAALDGYEALLRRTQMRGNRGWEIATRTAGLAMSPDGHTLWAACEEGIFEIDMLTKGRMFLPALEPR